MRRVLKPGTDPVALPGRSLEFFFPNHSGYQYPCIKILIARKLILKNKEPTGRLLIPDLITRSKLNNQPTTEQARVQRVLKTRTETKDYCWVGI